jgi:DNA-binding beta-propeller fold protein YncE
MRHILWFFLALIWCEARCQAQTVNQRVGPLPDDSFLLNNGWRLKPAGKQLPLDTLPMASALSPDGRYLLILNGGYKPPSIRVIDISSAREVSSTPVPDAWLGLVFTANGDKVYAGGGSRGAVFEFSFGAGKLTPARTIPLSEKPAPEDFVGDVALAPRGQLLFAAGLYRDSIDMIDLRSGKVLKRIATGRRPYRLLFHPDGRSLFVTSWADARLFQHRTDDGELLGSIGLGAHPTDMVWQPAAAVSDWSGEKPVTDRLFVAAAHTNHVFVVGVSSRKELRVIEKINVSLTPRQPVGMTPSALALDRRQGRLLVACSDANAVALVDVSQPESRVRGFIPTGWYPTAVRWLPDDRLIVLNGRGSRSYPNSDGPIPTEKQPGPGASKDHGYVGVLQTGTASLIDPLTDKQLIGYTRTVFANSPYRDGKLDAIGAAGTPIPIRPGEPSPIKHVIYIIKENRTYDQVLGDLGKGNGDSSLVLFGENVSPNHHKLAREFVLFDNFYVNADVSKDGWHWSTAGIAADFVQKLWPSFYAHRDRFTKFYGAEEPAAATPNGYLWSHALVKGISIRNYGFFVRDREKPTADGVQVADVSRDPALKPFTNYYFRGLDLNYPDRERARVFLREFSEYEKQGELPALILLRLGNDHTQGAQGGKLTPLSHVADNDYALGMVVESVSKSRFWRETAIFVVEDDAQDGPDHVDSHRSIAYVLSPFVKRRFIDSTMYNTSSMLRTMELILGLDPMTHFDAGAEPMFRAFTRTPDLTPYKAEAPRVSLTDRNPSGTELDKRTLAMDFGDADEADDQELNDILWRAIRGAPAPPPVRSYFRRVAR